MEKGEYENMKSLRLIVDTTPKSGILNMAIDEAIMNLFNKDDPPTLRFYKWEKPCLSIGKFQKISEIDLKFLDKMSIDLVRRPTGGKAVLHYDEITYSIVIPLDFFEKKDIISTYKKIALAIVKGFEKLGINANLSQRRKNRESKLKRACFYAPSIYEVTVNGKKLVGSAQVRNSKVLLQHGSIPFSLDLDTYSRCFELDDNSKHRLKRILMMNTVTINQLNSEITEQELISSLTKGFEQVFDLKHFRDDYSIREIKVVESLQIKYASKEWTFKR